MSAEDDIRDAEDEVVHQWLHEDSISHPDSETAALAARTLTLIQDRDAEIDRLRAELADCRAEGERLHTWAGLMSLLDEHWPADIFQADPTDDTADLGPRIVALLRWLDDCRAAGDAVLALHKPVDGPLDSDDNRIKVCDHCIDGYEEPYAYPCPTVQAWRSGR